MSNENLDANLKNVAAQADQTAENTKTVWKAAWAWLSDHPVTLFVIALVIGYILG